MLNQGSYKIGEWLRVYTTSLRGPGSSIEIGEVIGFGKARHHLTGSLLGETVIIKNAQAGTEVLLVDVIERIDPVALWNEMRPGETLPAYLVEWQKRVEVLKDA